ncbi:alpha-1-antitrypsin-like protein CM55-MS [Lithobates pipiens]
MRVFLFVFLSQVLLCAGVFGHHEKQEEHHEKHVDNHTEETSPLKKIVSGNVKFSYSLYSHLAKKYPSDNLFFSPMSISLLFSMLSAGAKGQTQTQIHETLGFKVSATSEDINKGFQQLLHFVNQPNTDLELSSANALFLEQNTELIEKFVEDLKNFYESEVIHSDFQKGDEAKNQINSYVEKKTNGKIKELLERVSPATLLVLINTIYFKGTWVHSFDEILTREADFHVDENRSIKVPMMTIREKFLVANVREMGCVVIDIPYKGNTSAILIVPDKGKLQDVERALQNVSLQTWASLMRPMEIFVAIPKFCAEATINLKSELSEMGMKDVFTGKANLSGITKSHVEVSEAIHKAVLKIDEMGSEAAGASAAVITKLSLPFRVVVDRPFLITILHKPTSTILFTGRIMKPAKC